MYIRSGRVRLYTLLQFMPVFEFECIGKFLTREASVERCVHRRPRGVSAVHELGVAKYSSSEGPSRLLG